MSHLDVSNRKSFQNNNVELHVVSAFVKNRQL